MSYSKCVMLLFDGARFDVWSDLLSAGRLPNISRYIVDTGAFPGHEDLQAAIESTFQTVLSGLSRATLVHDVGFLDCADIGSLESLVMNDEIIAMTKRMLRGIEVSDDTLMLDLIDRIGPGGEFVSAKETARRCRAEIWSPNLMDRQAWFTWEAAGSLTTSDRIRARLREILATHRPPALPGGAAEPASAPITPA